MEATYFFKKITDKQDLDREEATELVQILFNENTLPAVTASVLTALKMKGETVDEILAFIEFLKKGMVKIPFKGLAIDTCGTGGDCRMTFNISSAAAIVVAGAGVAVAKHGNRSASGISGSADCFEALGVNINLTANEIKQTLDLINIAFIFAPLFHPLFKTVGPVRREIKIRTIFNLIGPLLNPTGVKRQIIGVNTKYEAEKISLVVQRLNFDHILIFHSADGMDEISIYDKTNVFEVKKKRIRKFTIDPAKFKMKGENRSDVSVNSIEESREKILSVLYGRKGDCRKITILNSAAALYVSGKYKNMEESIKVAEESIDSGSAFETLQKLIKVSNSF